MKFNLNKTLENCGDNSSLAVYGIIKGALPCQSVMVWVWAQSDADSASAEAWCCNRKAILLLRYGSEFAACQVMLVFGQLKMIPCFIRVRWWELPVCDFCGHWVWAVPSAHTRRRVPMEITVLHPAMRLYETRIKSFLSNLVKTGRRLQSWRGGGMSSSCLYLISPGAGLKTHQFFSWSIDFLKWRYRLRVRFLPDW